MKMPFITHNKSNKTRSIPRQSGFTLVEIVVVMGLLSIFMLVLTDMFVSISKVETESQASAAVSQDGRFLLARLSHDVRRSSSITTPLAGGDITSSVSMTINGETYLYELSAGRLQLTNGLGSHSLNSSSTTISNFSAQKVNGSPELLQLEYTVTSVAQDNTGFVENTYSTTVGAR